VNRVAIVGCEASGKTVLTASLADFFQPGDSGRSCSMVPENAAAHKFFEYTQYQMRTKHAWPQATNPDKTTVMKWSMRVDGDVVANLETLDFGGEVFRAAFREGEPTAGGAAAQKELLDYLSVADFIVVTVSLGVLMRDIELSNGITPADFARDAEAKWVTRGLLDFVRKSLPADTGVVIALTQADVYYDELEKYGGPDGLFKKSWPTVAALYPDMPVVAVSSVSGVSEDGSPAEDYSSEGVVPLTSVFADFCVGGVDALRETISSTIGQLRDAPENTDPREYRRRIDEYTEAVRLFRVASGLTGDYYDDEFNRYVSALVDGEGEFATRLRQLEARALAKYKAQEEERKKAEEAARIAREEKRKADEAAERKRREEDAKRAEDERVKAEKELEKSRLEAEVELEKSRAIVKRNMARVLVALLSVGGLASVGGLYYLVDTTHRAAEVETMRVREVRRAAFTDQVDKLAEAAHDGDVAAAQRLLGLIESNELSEADVNGLYKIYMLLVNEGDARAMFRLGVACHEGTCGVKKSDFNAHWFLTMAEKSGYKSPRLAELLAQTAAAKEVGTAQSQDIDTLFVGNEAETNAPSAESSSPVPGPLPPNP